MDGGCCLGKGWTLDIRYNDDSSIQSRYGILLLPEVDFGFLLLPVTYGPRYVRDMLTHSCWCLRSWIKSSQVGSAMRSMQIHDSDIIRHNNIIKRQLQSKHKYRGSKTNHFLHCYLGGKTTSQQVYSNFDIFRSSVAIITNR